MQAVGASATDTHCCGLFLLLGSGGCQPRSWPRHSPIQEQHRGLGEGASAASHQPPRAPELATLAWGLGCQGQPLRDYHTATENPGEPG